MMHLEWVGGGFDTWACLDIAESLGADCSFQLSSNKNFCKMTGLISGLNFLIMFWQCGSHFPAIPQPNLKEHVELDVKGVQVSKEIVPEKFCGIPLTAPMMKRKYI